MCRHLDDVGSAPRFAVAWSPSAMLAARHLANHGRLSAFNHVHCNGGDGAWPVRDKLILTR